MVCVIMMKVDGQKRLKNAVVDVDFLKGEKIAFFKQKRIRVDGALNTD